MNILYYDCFAGISGDMNLGAMIDIGVDIEYLRKELSRLKIDKEFKLDIKKDKRKGITGTKVHVLISHNVESQYNGHEEEHSHHHHRNLNDIKKIIMNSDLNENVKRISVEMFMKVAEAEGKIHGKSIEEVHFHEVGAVDSIVDIVGAAICFDYLNVDKVFSSSVEVGGGFVRCAHGLMPVPAPATAEILKGIPMKSGADNYETTTPTGAAILATQVKEFTDKKDFITEKIGYGIGTKDENIPNVLRVFLAKKKLV